MRLPYACALLVMIPGCSGPAVFEAEWTLSFLGEPLADEATLWFDTSDGKSGERSWSGQSDGLSLVLTELPREEGWVELSGLADSEYQLCALIEGESYMTIGEIDVSLTVPWDRQVTVEDDICFMTFLWARDLTTQWSEETE